MNLFTTVSKDEFLNDYWQKKPVVFRHAFDDVKDFVSGDELAGLACEDVVESRIIRGFEADGKWSCEHGPFVDYDYDSLGERDWTLLVQGLDQWDSDVRALLNQFDFLPRWRLEDVMASFAPRGGGVGPHFDYYDVFLVQTSGRRRWQTGQTCTEDTPLRNNAQVRLLEEFVTRDTHDLNAGDAIYIPAGCAHWGTSLSDDCVTLSVGFRAPSDKELLSEAVELLVQRLSDAKRYQDTSKSIDTDPYKINATAAEYAHQLLSRVDTGMLEEALGEALGRLVTDTRYCSFSEEPSSWTSEAVEQLMKRGAGLIVSHQPHCRLAYSDTQLFVNGVAYELSPEFSKRVCKGVVTASLNPRELAVLATLANDDMVVLTPLESQP
ncbi:MAG: cupin domain-containing protein [Gammaproteobacteria bacterium]